VNAFFAAAALVSTLVASPAENPLTGEWKVRNDIASNVSEMTCNFTQKGEDLTGGCATEQGNVEIAGKVVETNVTWIFKSVYNGGPITLTYKGSLGTDGNLAGAVTVEEFSVTGEFTGTPVKPAAK
jgi:hypothetical protein